MAEHLQISQRDVINLSNWVEENKSSLEPPICNKSIYDNQLMVFIVGGPNQRKDYHIEEGEEIFYMIKGDMCLKVLENGEHKDIVIKQGEMFLLPSRTLHSPQRQPNTIGLVIERKREAEEKDGVIYFTEQSGQPTSSILYEKYTHCGSISRDLRPIIEQYFQSEQYRTGIPDPEDLVKSPPISADNSLKLEKPFVFSDYINQHKENIQKNKILRLFGGKGEQFNADILGEGDFEIFQKHLETFLWVHEGSLQLKSESFNIEMKKNEIFLVPANNKCYLSCSDGSAVFQCSQQRRQS